MKNFRTFTLVAIVVLLSSASFAQGADGPETGYFRVFMTPTEVSGEAGAQVVAEVLPPDEEINWQIYVPHNYSADNPPGVVVYVSPLETGGPPQAWNDLLGEHNLIWIGANGSGNKHPVTERILKALLATTVLQKTYTINMRRCYVAGFSGGGKTAMRMAALWPEQFKGGIYIAGAVFWGNKPPPKIDLIRQNKHVFIVGSFDPALRDTRRVYNDYKDAGVENSELITVRNHNHRMPPKNYFIQAIEYLDSETTTQGAE